VRPTRRPEALRLGLLLALAACTPPAATPASAPAPTARPRSTVPAKAASLLDAAPADVQAALGAPDLQRRDGSALVWLYATAGGCRVDVVFYPKADGPHVAHAAARTPSSMQEAACLAMVAARP
jgi:hypothetical protein